MVLSSGVLILGLEELVTIRVVSELRTVWLATMELACHRIQLPMEHVPDMVSQYQLIHADVMEVLVFH